MTLLKNLLKKIIKILEFQYKINTENLKWYQKTP